MVRFDQPCFLVKGAVEYFREHMALGDYLTQEGRSEMTWAGKGAAMLGLAGQCDLKHFENLCRGLHPVSGEKLMVRNKGASRRVCYFGQVSPPKDVSILHLVGGDQRIAGWWREAVAETVREIEVVTATRVRRAGANLDRQTGNMVTALVTHDANRSLDPQLHTHLCIMNVTYDATEGRWKSVQPTGFYRHQGFFREVCYNRLAARMLEAGYELEPVRRIGFTVKGMPAELRDTFSKRRKEILREAAETTSQDELQNIALRTRAGKTNATAATLRARWLVECGGHLEALRAVIASAQGTFRPVSSVTPLDAVDSAGAHVFERRSVVDVRVLLREGLVAGRGQVTLEALKQAVAFRERAGELIRSGDEVASQAGLEAEKEFTGWASAEVKACAKLGIKPPTAGLGRDQIRAVTGLLASHSRVVILQGDAGTGKTTCLKAIVAGIERRGGEVFGCAPSSGATDVLRHELTTDADTLQKLLASEALQRSVRGRILIVDEAGLVSVREMRNLCRIAARNGNRLLLVGDIKQHHSVEAGDALRCLQEYARVPVHRLSEIRRQQDPAYRKAVARLAAGDAFGAFKRFEKLGAVHEVTSPAAMLAAAADDYVRTVRAGKSCLAISPVWSEIHDFTREVRRQLRAAGLLANQERTALAVYSLKWTREERRRLGSYQSGDVLTFHRACGRFSKHEALTVQRREERQLVVRDDTGCEYRLDPRRVTGFDVGIPRETPVAIGDRLLLRGNLKSAGLKNGDLAEVSGFGSNGTIELKDGRAIPGWFRDFSHGYAATSHASQGKTVDRGLLLMADEGIAAGNLKQAYVSNSRFRESQGIYTTDREAAREAMMRFSDRKLATDLIGPADDTPVPPHLGWRARWTARLSPIIRTAA